MRLVCDVARPRDVSWRVHQERDDVLVIEGGMVEVPGPVDFGFQFRFSTRQIFRLHGRDNGVILSKVATKTLALVNISLLRPPLKLAKSLPVTDSNSVVSAALSRPSPLPKSHKVRQRASRESRRVWSPPPLLQTA